MLGAGTDAAENDQPAGGRQNRVRPRARSHDPGSGHGKILIGMQNTCGERPQIGKVFQFKGTKTVGVFFTVTDHSKGNKKVGGMVLSAASGPSQVEAALLSDDASRIGKTVNPMLQQLFGVWHPDSQAAASGSAAGGQSASAGNDHSGPDAHLHTVTAPDNSASIGIPDGWQLDPRSAGSTMALIGPNGEIAVYAANKPAVDPYNPQQVKRCATESTTGRERCSTPTIRIWRGPIQSFYRLGDEPTMSRR